DGNNGGQRKYKLRVKNQVKVFSGCDIELWKQQVNKQDCNQKREECHRHGFTQILKNQQSSACADCLFDADLLDASCRLCSGKIHEVDAGNEEDKRSDH